jgi:hypothetical protein
VIKWLQGLDLAYSIKNPKHDFANGFMVAELLTRFNEQGIAMHSYDPAPNSKAKKNNWELLEVFFRRNEMPFSVGDWRPVMHEAPGAAVNFLKKLYTHLTGKELAEAPKHPPVNTVQTHLEETQGFDERSVRTQLLAEESEYESTDRPPQAALKQLSRGVLRPLTKTEDMRTQPVQIREVEVKPVERNLQQLKETKSISLHRTSNEASLQSSFKTLESPTKLKDSAAPEAVLKNSQEFWTVWAASRPVLERNPPQSENFLKTMESLAQLGEKMVAQEAANAEAYFAEVAMKSLTILLKRAPAKREYLCHLVYSYCQSEPSARLRVIQNLSEHLKDMAELVRCLAVLIKYDKEFSEELHDVFIYYALLGCEHSAPSVRTAALAVFSHLGSLNYQPVLYVVPHLRHLAEDSWWEVRAQVLQCAASLLNAIDDTTEDVKEMESLVTLKDVVGLCLVPTTHRSVLRVGLVYLAPVLYKHPYFADLYVECLLSLSPDLSAAILGTSLESETQSLIEEGLFVLGPSTQRYKLGGVPLLWDPTIVANALALHVKRNALENLEEQHVEVLKACLMQEPSDLQKWYGVFDILKEYVFVGLCDPEICTSAAFILRRFLTASALQERTIKVSRETLQKTLQLLLSGEPQESTVEVCFELLRSLYWDYEQQVLKDFVHEAVQSFMNKYPELARQFEVETILSE